MAVVNLLLSPWALLAAVLGLATYYIYPYFVTYGRLRGVPAPFPAQLTNLWLLSVVRQGNRYLTVDQLHKKLGPVVRIQPNHISVADDEAIHIIYGHGNGFLKS
jgi:benzoate 4-monooxygenase